MFGRASELHPNQEHQHALVNSLLGSELRGKDERRTEEADSAESLGAHERGEASGLNLGPVSFPLSLNYSDKISLVSGEVCDDTEALL